MAQEIPKQSRFRAGFTRTFSALSERKYRFLWFGMLFSMAAMQINIVARGWLAFDLTGSAAMLGIVAGARSLPQLMFAPIGGVVADRVDKRRLLVTTQIALVVLSLVNAVLVHIGIIQIWHLVVISMVQGVLQPFNMPARTAVIPDLVKEDQVSNALALDSTGRNINRVAAPALAGILIAIDVTLAFYAIAAGYVLATATLFNLPRGLKAKVASRGAITEMGVGFSYIWQNRHLFGLIVAAFGITLLGMPFQHLLPVFQEDVLNVGPRSLGFMFTAVGLGAITGSLVIAYISERPDLGRLQLGLGIGFGLSLAAFALSTSFVLSLGLLVIVGFMSQGYMTLNRMQIMLQTDRQLFGRVMSIYMMTWALVPAAVLPIGFIADRIGVGATMFFSAVALTIFLAGLKLSMPQIFGQRPAVASRGESRPARSA